MPLALRTTVDATAQSRKLKRLEKAGAVTPILEAIGKAAVRFSRKLFTTRGKDIGGWKPLSPNTIAAKGVNSPLVTSGDLMASVQYKVIPGARVQVGTDVPYAKYHEFGTRPFRIVPVKAKALSFVTTNGRIFTKAVNHPGIPRRPFLPPPDEAKRLAKKAADDYIEKLSDGEG